MKLHFIGGKISEVKIEKEGRKWITIYCPDNTRRYRVDKETGIVQDNTYHNTIKGLFID